MYSEIASNRRRSAVLLGLVGSLLVGLGYVFGQMYGLSPVDSISAGLIFSFGYTMISYFFGDKIALGVAGAKPIQKSDAPELYRIVENLCIANGQPLPKIYLIPDDSPNAFATGRKPETASIAFTTGLIKLLDKTELEGVAAHELSHVKNFDIRVMMLAAVLVGGIMLLSDILLRSTFHRGRDEKQGGNILVIVGIALALLSPIFAQLIQLAISRQREYLADASGALLTRYPAGLASALQKISAVASQSPLDRANHATAHLYISNPFGENSKRWLSSLFSTHPPTAERVARLNKMGEQP